MAETSVAQSFETTPQIFQPVEKAWDNNWIEPVKVQEQQLTKPSQSEEPSVWEN